MRAQRDTTAMVIRRTKACIVNMILIVQTMRIMILVGLSSLIIATLINARVVGRSVEIINAVLRVSTKAVHANR